MIKGKNAELVLKVFLFFAIFPEDVPVPAGVFNVLAPILTSIKDLKKAKLSVGSSLCTLMNYNLLKGSLSTGGGVFMHDIVRDYVIEQHAAAELRALQKRVVRDMLAARPEAGGFPASDYTAADSFEGYVARQLYWHFRGGLAEGGEEPSNAWLTHPDNIVKANLAMAVGIDFLSDLSNSREAAGALVHAAEASW